MKRYSRLDAFRTATDALSAYLEGFRFEIDYFTNWPMQDHKKMIGLVSNQVKLVMQARGTCELTIKGEKHRMGAGGCILLPPYTVYDGETFADVDAYELFFSVTPITREQEFLQRLGLDRPMLLPDFFSPEEFIFIRQYYANIRDKREGAYANLNAMLTQLLVRIVREHKPASCQLPATSREQGLVDRAIAYLDDHLAEPVQVQALCEALHVSQSYMYRCSMKVMNCSTIEIIIRYKMKHAQHLLKDPDLSIAEVADQLGYDLFYFSSQFKRQFHMSPSAYRKMQASLG